MQLQHGIARDMEGGAVQSVRALWGGGAKGVKLRQSCKLLPAKVQAALASRWHSRSRSSCEVSHGEVAGSVFMPDLAIHDR